MPLELGARQMKNYNFIKIYYCDRYRIKYGEDYSIKYLLRIQKHNKISERQCGRNCFQCYNPELNFNSPEQDRDFESYENVHDFQCNYDQEQYETPHQLD